jgi:hypothetical protein
LRNIPGLWRHLAQCIATLTTPTPTQTWPNATADATGDFFLLVLFLFFLFFFLFFFCFSFFSLSFFSFFFERASDGRAADARNQVALGLTARDSVPPENEMNTARR